MRSVRIGARAVGGQVSNMQGVELRQALQSPPGARCDVHVAVGISPMDMSSLESSNAFVLENQLAREYNILNGISSLEWGIVFEMEYQSSPSGFAERQA